MSGFIGGTVALNIKTYKYVPIFQYMYDSTARPSMGTPQMCS